MACIELSIELQAELIQLIQQAVVAAFGDRIESGKNRFFMRTNHLATRKALHRLIDSCTKETSDSWMQRWGDG